MIDESLPKSQEELERLIQVRTEQLIKSNEALQSAIARRQEVEEALRQAERQFRNLFENSVQGIFQSTPDGRYLSMNATLAHIYGYDSLEDAIQAITNIETQIYADPSRRYEFKRILELEGEVRDFEYEGRRKDGSKIWISASARAVQDTNETVLYYEGTAEDITRRKRAEEALKQSEEDYRSIFENAVEGICRSTVDGKFLKVNPALVKMLGYDSEEELLNVDIPTQVYYDPLDRLEFQRKIAELDKVTSLELRMKKRNGELIHVNVNDRIQRDDNGEILYYEATIEDVTERKKTEEALQRAHAELEMRVRERTAELARANRDLMEYQHQLRLMASELSLLQEEERRKMATYLHDTIGQALAVAKIKLKGVQEAVWSNGILDSTNEILELIDFAIQETRSLTFDLSPPILYELGFESAVEWLAEQIAEKQNLRITYHNDRAEKPLGNDIRVVLFQTMRELLRNVVKHAQAKNVKISLCREEGILRIDVEDDGIGFDTSQIFSYRSKNRGFGLFDIRERLRHLGGHVEVKSQAGVGTHVTLTAPVRVESHVNSAELKWP
ncbi:MAG: PAS domain S-box protein [Bacteroidota bacterium]